MPAIHTSSSPHYPSPAPRDLQTLADQIAIMADLLESYDLGALSTDTRADLLTAVDDLCAIATDITSAAGELGDILRAEKRQDRRRDDLVDDMLAMADAYADAQRWSA